MATPKAQKKWRDKHSLVKKQLNVMARKSVHEYLDEMAETYSLRGKGEAVTFACFMTRALVHRAEYNSEAARMLDDFTEAYHRDRELYAA